MAIGVARRGGRRSGERTLRVPPSCSDPVSHACGPHVASFVRRSSMCALASVRACGRAQRAAQRGASRKKERPAKKGVGTLKKKRKNPEEEKKVNNSPCGPRAIISPRTSNDSRMTWPVLIRPVFSGSTLVFGKDLMTSVALQLTVSLACSPNRCLVSPELCTKWCTGVWLPAEAMCTFPQEGGFLVMRGDRGGLGQKRHGVVAFWPFPTIRRFTRQSLPPTEGRSGCPECHWDLAGRLGDHLSLGLSLFSPPTRPSSFSFSL